MQYSTRDHEISTGILKYCKPVKSCSSSFSSLPEPNGFAKQQKVPYPGDNFLLSACQFMASNQGNGKFSLFACMEPTLSPRNCQSFNC